MEVGRVGPRRWRSGACGREDEIMHPIATSATVVFLLSAQAPRIALIDFYGVRKVSLAELRKALAVREGDPLPPSKGDTEERLEQVRGVVRARLEAVCCEDDGAILYVGIEERGAPHFDYRLPPASDAVLPEEVTDLYEQFLALYRDAARRGVGEDYLAHGHPLSLDPAVRAVQERFPALVDAHLSRIRQVLRNSADERHRAIAAQLIGYTSKKHLIVNDLQYALRDPDDGVRYNAVRALVAIAKFGERDPERGLKVEPTWLIEMLNSLLWNDRMKAAEALAVLTEKREAGALAQLRERALDSVVEMARWKHLRHALPAFLLAGRLAGLSEQEIEEAWSRGDREAVLRKLQAGGAGPGTARRARGSEPGGQAGEAGGAPGAASPTSSFRMASRTPLIKATASSVENRRANSRASSITTIGGVVSRVIS
jgi:hypothetical protein